MHELQTKLASNSPRKSERKLSSPGGQGDGKVGDGDLNATLVEAKLNAAQYAYERDELSQQCKKLKAELERVTGGGKKAHHRPSHQPCFTVLLPALFTSLSLPSLPPSHCYPFPALPLASLLPSPPLLTMLPALYTNTSPSSHLCSSSHCLILSLSQPSLPLLSSHVRAFLLHYPCSTLKFCLMYHFFCPPSLRLVSPCQVAQQLTSIEVKYEELRLKYDTDMKGFIDVKLALAEAQALTVDLQAELLTVRGR